MDTAVSALTEMHPTNNYFFPEHGNVNFYALTNARHNDSDEFRISTVRHEPAFGSSLLRGAKRHHDSIA